jgi:hypothetical protein
MGKPAGQLALGPEGLLGDTKPKDSTTYREQLATGDPADGESAVFQTKPVKQALHLTGQPVLDAWIQSSTSDGHVAVELEVLGKDGEPLTHTGSNGEAQATYGVRSLQHIEPMNRGWFEQEAGVAFPVNEPMKVEVRFLPTDLVVPKGGSLRLTVSGSVAYSKGESLPSGAAADITLLHSCDYPSALRFLMPDPKAQLLNVREEDQLQEPKLSSRRQTMGRRDGGGLASASVCGRKPALTSALQGFPGK